MITDEESLNKKHYKEYVKSHEGEAYRVMSYEEWLYDKAYGKFTKQFDVDEIVKVSQSICGEKQSKGREYMEWLDTKPKVFLSYREWLFTYYPKEV